MTDQIYIARLKHPFAEVEPITKDISSVIKSDKDMTIAELIKYLIKDNGFSDDEKNIANTVSEMMNRCSAFITDPSSTNAEILAIRALDKDGTQRTFTSGYVTREDVETGKYLDPTAKALEGQPLFFEDRTLENEKYKGLDLEVATQGSGGNYC